MTTPSHPVPGPEASNTDAMDLHSDAGFDIGELDFDAFPGIKPNDDDVLSLKDAESVAGVDSYVNTGEADDDPMIDDEDHTIQGNDNIDVEFDDVDELLANTQHQGNAQEAGARQDDGVTAHPLNTGPANAPAAVASNSKAIDNDIINWEEDEDQEQLSTEQMTNNPGDFENDKGAADDKFPGEESATHQSPRFDEQISTAYTEQHSDTEQLVDYGDDVETGAAPKDETAKVEYINQHDDFDNENRNFIDGSGDFNEYDIAELDTLAQQDLATYDDAVDAADAQQHIEVNSESQHQVTVSYDSVEYWLFKPPQSEDSDWLLEDESLRSKPLHDLFTACRVRLGSDVGPETEIGLRFDHLYNLELYEDSTACAYTSLGSLLNVYLTLNEQDGTVDPESFYMTFRFRPRVSALVNQLNKAVEDGMGYEGLCNAVNAGETLFNTSFLGTGNEEAVDDSWQNEQQDGDQDGEHAPGTADASTQQDHSQEFDLDDQYEDAEVDPENDMEQPVSPSLSQDPPVQTHLAANQNQHHSVQTSSNSSAQDTPATGPKVDEDEIDFTSDEEEDDKIAPTSQGSANGPSSASSTVQGDDASDAHVENENSADDSGIPEGDNYYDNAAGIGADETYLGDSLEEVEQGQSQYQNDQHYNEFEDAYDEDQFAPDYDAEGVQLQDAIGDADGIATVEDGGNIVVNEHGALELATDNSAVEAFVDLGDNQTTEDNEPDYYEGDHSGSQAQVEASPAEQTNAQSSGLVDSGSPQGHKRPIDDLGLVLDSFGDSTDAKRPRKL